MEMAESERVRTFILFPHSGRPGIFPRSRSTSVCNPSLSALSHSRGGRDFPISHVPSRT